MHISRRTRTNCDAGNRTDYLAAGMRNWLEIAIYGLEAFERKCAQRNYWRLLLAYPEIAIAAGLPLDVPEDWR
jgi:hypothetical protein